LGVCFGLVSGGGKRAWGRAEIPNQPPKRNMGEGKSIKKVVSGQGVIPGALREISRKDTL